MIPPKLGWMIVTGFVIVNVSSLISKYDKLDVGETRTNACEVGLFGMVQLYVAGFAVALYELVINDHVTPLLMLYSNLKDVNAGEWSNVIEVTVQPPQIVIPLSPFGVMIVAAGRIVKKLSLSSL